MATVASVQLKDNDGGFVQKVDSSGAAVMMDIVHKRIHEGIFFSGTLFDAALLAAGVLEMLIQTSATHDTHFRATASGSQDHTVEVFEGTTFSGAGTALPMFNRDRQSATVIESTVTHTPTLTLDGTLFIKGFIPGGSGGNAQGGGGALFEEYILDRSESYLVRLTNLGSQTGIFDLQLDIYEEPSGE